MDVKTGGDVRPLPEASGLGVSLYEDELAKRRKFSTVAISPLSTSFKSSGSGASVSSELASLVTNKTSIMSSHYFLKCIIHCLSCAFSFEKFGDGNSSFYRAYTYVEPAFIISTSWRKNTRNRRFLDYIWHLYRCQSN